MLALPNDITIAQAITQPPSWVQQIWDAFLTTGPVPTFPVLPVKPHLVKFRPLSKLTET